MQTFIYMNFHKAFIFVPVTFKPLKVLAYLTWDAGFRSARISENCSICIIILCIVAMLFWKTYMFLFSSRLDWPKKVSACRATITKYNIHVRMYKIVPHWFMTSIHFFFLRSSFLLSHFHGVFKYFWHRSILTSGHHLPYAVASLSQYYCSFLSPFLLSSWPMGMSYRQQATTVGGRYVLVTAEHGQY